MEWLSQNWGWLILAGAFLGMHFFGHRNHGGAGGCCDGGHGEGRRPDGKGKMAREEATDGSAQALDVDQPPLRPGAQT
ncbi:MAG: hypothetical protein OEW98_07220 [Betaproteobacteria bacterium]|jgi:hypothetical protein|nr:hypothetical protein [Betaproteobacteria bacterium]